jgi:hypothetical protein
MLELAKYGVEEGKSLLKRGWNIAAFLEERTTKFKYFTCPRNRS